MKWIKLSEQKHPAFLQPVFLYKPADPKIEGDKDQYDHGYLTNISRGEEFYFETGANDEGTKKDIGDKFTHYAIPQPPKQ